MTLVRTIVAVRSRLFVALLFPAVFLACKDQNQEPPPAPAIDKQQLCADGGAAFDPNLNQCVCPPGMDFVDNRCQATDPKVVAQQECEAQGKVWREDSCHDPDPEPDPKPEPDPDPDPGVDRAKVQQACAAAGGDWQAADQFCDCPDDKVLVGQECSKLSGRLIEAVCERAVLPGAWKSGRCECPQTNLVFSPARGGCVEPFDGSEATISAICEDSLNQGQWLADRKTCQCPTDEIWHQEYCQPQDELSSRAICESDFNDGRWDGEEKSCICQIGDMWINQSCQSIQAIDPKIACEAEVNGGTWDQSRGLCICPGVTGWVPAVKSCQEGGVTAAQQLCLQSGGRPGDDHGDCSCPSGFVVANLEPQGFEYCVQNDDEPDIPDWLKILLGIF